MKKNARCISYYSSEKLGNTLQTSSTNFRIRKTSSQEICKMYIRFCKNYIRFCINYVQFGTRNRKFWPIIILTTLRLRLKWSEVNLSKKYLNNCFARSSGECNNRVLDCSSIQSIIDVMKRSTGISSRSPYPVFFCFYSYMTSRAALMVGSILFNAFSSDLLNAPCMFKIAMATSHGNIGKKW